MNTVPQNSGPTLGWENEVQQPTQTQPTQPIVQQQQQVCSIPILHLFDWL